MTALNVKHCRKCSTDKPLSDFTKNSNSPDGHYSMCRVCKTNAQYKATYGISLEDYESMLELQDSCCAICDTHLHDTGKKRLYVDHCHTTGKVRGLLCQHCNFVLGQARDNISVLESAIVYLKERG